MVVLFNREREEGQVRPGHGAIKRRGRSRGVARGADGRSPSEMLEFMIRVGELEGVRRGLSRSRIT